MVQISILLPSSSLSSHPSIPAPVRLCVPQQARHIVIFFSALTSTRVRLMLHSQCRISPRRPLLPSRTPRQRGTFIRIANPSTKPLLLIQGYQQFGHLRGANHVRAVSAPVRKRHLQLLNEFDTIVRSGYQRRLLRAEGTGAVEAPASSQCLMALPGWHQGVDVGDCELLACVDGAGCVGGMGEGGRGEAVSKARSRRDIMFSELARNYRIQIWCFAHLGRQSWFNLWSIKVCQRIEGKMSGDKFSFHDPSLWQKAYIPREGYCSRTMWEASTYRHLWRHHGMKSLVLSQIHFETIRVDDILSEIVTRTLPIQAPPQLPRLWRKLVDRVSENNRSLSKTHWFEYPVVVNGGRRMGKDHIARKYGACGHDPNPTALDLPKSERLAIGALDLRLVWRVSKGSENGYLCGDIRRRDYGYSSAVSEFGIGESTVLLVAMFLWARRGTSPRIDRGFIYWCSRTTVRSGFPLPWRNSSGFITPCLIDGTYRVTVKPYFLEMIQALGLGNER